MYILTCTMYTYHIHVCRSVVMGLWTYVWTILATLSCITARPSCLLSPSMMSMLSSIIQPALPLVLSLALRLALPLALSLVHLLLVLPRALLAPMKKTVSLTISRYPITQTSKMKWRTIMARFRCLMPGQPKVGLNLLYSLPWHDQSSKLFSFLCFLFPCPFACFGLFWLCLSGRGLFVTRDVAIGELLLVEKAIGFNLESRREVDEEVAKQPFSKRRFGSSVQVGQTNIT